MKVWVLRYDMCDVHLVLGVFKTLIAAKAAASLHARDADCRLRGSSWQRGTDCDDAPDNPLAYTRHREIGGTYTIWQERVQV